MTRPKGGDPARLTFTERPCVLKSVIMLYNTEEKWAASSKNAYRLQIERETPLPLGRRGGCPPVCRAPIGKKRLAAMGGNEPGMNAPACD